MANSQHTQRSATFTQCVRDLIGMLSYENILSCTVYLPPMLFMVGPAAIAPDNPVINIVLNAILGFALSWAVHRTGHRLLMGLPNTRQGVYLSPSVRLPVKLTLPQFVWMLEIIVAAAVFSWIVGKRLFVAGDSVGILSSMILFTTGFVMYFLPVYLGKIWMQRHYPTMPLFGPTEEQVSHSLSASPFVSTSKK